MRIVLELTGGMRAVLTHLPEELVLESSAPARLADLLVRAGIPPLLVVRAALGGRVVGLETVLDQDATVVLFGPLAGG